MFEPVGGEPSVADMHQRIAGLERQHLADQVLIDELQADLKLEFDKVENLEIALRTARCIGAAMGILMERHQLTEDQAFATLRTASQESHRKLRDVAAQFVETGALPTADA